jgi:N-methylhydantoinase B
MNRLTSITREMGYLMLRSTRSPILNQARDFVTGIFSPNGEQLAQTEYIPIISCMWPAISSTLKTYEGEIFPGDVFIFNDVFSGGNQLADVMVYKPVFNEKIHIGWVAVKGHVADIGGPVAGGYNPDAKEVWQEGIRIPPTKIYEKGVKRKDVWNLIFSNIRYDIVPRDIEAAISVCEFAEERFLSIVKQYSHEKFWKHIQYAFDIVEKRVRSFIKKIPEGVYKGYSYTTDVRDPKKKHIIHVKVKVHDGHLSFDYSESSPQTDSFGNGTWSTTYAATLVALYYILDPDIPHNQGVLRCFDIFVPEGTILNARFPAATAFGNQVCGDNIPIAIFKALSKVLPDRVTAEWCRWYGPVLVGKDPRTGSYFTDIGFFAGKGGAGAALGTDGWDHLGLLRNAGGVASQDMEMLEINDPILMVANELLPNSGGPGQWRGGLGMYSEWISLAQEAKLIVWGETTLPQGFNGGKSPRIKSRAIIIDKQGKKRRLKNFGVYELDYGSRVKWWITGGAGYGNPFKRDPDLVLEDFLNGKITAIEAKRNYGVTIGTAKKRVKEIAIRKLHSKK